MWGGNVKEKTRPGMLARLQEIIATQGLAELEILADDVIEALKSRSPYGLFEDILARHQWDEYCWGCVEGPPQLYDQLRLDVAVCIDSELDKKSDYTLICLTEYSRETLDTPCGTDETGLGSIDRHSITNACLDKIGEVVNSRHLDILGPDRSHVIGGYVTTNGPVFSMYDAGGLTPHMGVLIEPEADLEPIADEIADYYLSGLAEESENPDMDDFLNFYGDKVRDMIKTEEIIPGLEEVRRQLLAALDG